MGLKSWWHNARKKLANPKNIFKRDKTNKPKKTKKPKPTKKEKKTKKTEKAKNPKKAKVSVTTLYKKKKIQSKMNIKDIELIGGLDAKDLKKRYDVKGSKCKLLEEMVTDYQQGRLSLPGLSHKSKFDAKDLDKDRLERMLTNYDEAKTKRNAEDLKALKKNVEQLKKRLKLTPSRKKLLEKMLDDLKKRSDFELMKSQLDPKIVDKNKIDKLLFQYEAAQKQNRGISFLLTKSKLSMLASKRKFSVLLNEIKKMHVSDYFGQYY